MDCYGWVMGKLWIDMGRSGLLWVGHGLVWQGHGLLWQGHGLLWEDHRLLQRWHELFWVGHGLLCQDLPITIHDLPKTNYSEQRIMLTSWG